MSNPFDYIPSCSRTADYTKPTATASRVAQVEAELHSNQLHEFADELARTLAAEVDARDDVITELLALVKPEDGNTDAFLHVGDIYARACEIAGRTE